MAGRSYSREQLYEMVWAEPVTALAKRYGLSDVGFAKMCRRLKVPIPPRGYWAKRAAGRATPRIPLPPMTGGTVWLTEGGAQKPVAAPPERPDPLPPPPTKPKAPERARGTAVSAAPAPARKKGKLKTGRRRKRPDPLWRTVAITTFRASVKVRLKGEGDRDLFFFTRPRPGNPSYFEAEATLELRGSMDPIRKTSAVRITVFLAEPPIRPGPIEATSVGAVAGVRPELWLILWLLPREFDQLWTLAAAGQVRSAHVVLDELRYNDGVVLSADFSSDSPDPESRYEG